MWVSALPGQIGAGSMYKSINTSASFALLFVHRDSCQGTLFRIPAFPCLEDQGAKHQGSGLWMRLQLQLVPIRGSPHRGHVSHRMGISQHSNHHRLFTFPTTNLMVYTTYPTANVPLSTLLYHSATSPGFGWLTLTILSQLSKHSGSNAFLSCLIASTVLVPTSCSR